MTTTMNRSSGRELAPCGDAARIGGIGVGAPAGDVRAA